MKVNNLKSKRVKAGFIDIGIAFLLLLINSIGGLLATIYLLTKEAFFYNIFGSQSMKDKSIGKKIMGLKIDTKNNNYVSYETSLKRNLLISIGFMPIINTYGFKKTLYITVIALIIELILFLFNDGKRLGDIWANTQVINDLENSSNK